MLETRTSLGAAVCYLCPNFRSYSTHFPVDHVTFAGVQTGPHMGPQARSVFADGGRASYCTRGPVKDCQRAIAIHVYGLNGIRVIAASVVHVENCVIDSFRSTTVGFGHGILVNTTAGSELHVRNTTIRNCLNDGISLNTSAGQVIASVVNSKISKNGNGIKALNGVVASIVNCEITSHSGVGIDAQEVALATQVNVDGCNIAFNSIGVEAGTGASEVRLSNNFIAQNGTGVNINGGTVATSGNNRLLGNPIAVGGGALQPVTQPQ